jgi:DEAD/DEAH box helicase domain-containing protein
VADACDTALALARDAALADRAAFATTIPARPARFAELDAELHPMVRERLEARGLFPLWKHQAAAVDLLRAGEHTVVTTGTASGKSLCYQVPIVDAVANTARSTALLVFPTKALAQDQLRSLREWLVPDLVAATYDGDTPTDDRVRIRRTANVVLTNPEMLHQGILPFHERWATFLLRLRYVVVDELHALRGIFGSHVAHVLRRLRRVTAHYGANPTMCFTSATIGNAEELAAALCADPVTAVTDDGAPQAERAFVCWQRPLLDVHTGTRASANVETADLLARFVSAGYQTLAFGRSRRSSELVAATAGRLLTERCSEGAPRVAAYRAGYLPAERRELEQSLSDGTLRGVAATTALELGIDVGGLDAVVLNGFPGTLASMRQQAGRAGRDGRRAAAVLVCGDDQLDQWYARHPRELLDRPAEAAVANPDNPFVLAPHVACAAHELPLAPSDERWFGPGFDDAVRDHVMADRLKPRNGRMFWAGREPPAPGVSLRTGSSVEFDLVDDAGDVVGTVDGSRVFQVAHPGAIYLHQGRTYRVATLDTDDHRALLESADDADEFTQTREHSDLVLVSSEAPVAVGAGAVRLATVEVTTNVTAYQRTRVSTREVIEVVDLDLPPSTLTTRAVCLTVPLTSLLGTGLAPGRVLGTVHAAEHAMIGLLPLFAICDRWDVGGVSTPLHPATGEPTIFVYDGYPGGAGIAELSFARVHEHLAAARDTVAECPCDEGCPSCVQSPKCGNWNEYLDKAGAVTLLGMLTRD